jgi:hypothetical protein
VLSAGALSAAAAAHAIKSNGAARSLRMSPS